MGINWFEGGRRIVLLLVVLIIIGGAVYVIASNGDDRVVIETSSPDKPLLWTLNRCSYPDFAKECDAERLVQALAFPLLVCVRGCEGA